jgi:hypothetical protein
MRYILSLFLLLDEMPDNDDTDIKGKLYNSHTFICTIADSALVAFQQSHSDVFPSKTVLKHKVRELRQKILAKS